MWTAISVATKFKGPETPRLRGKNGPPRKILLMFVDQATNLFLHAIIAFQRRQAIERYSSVNRIRDVATDEVLYAYLNEIYWWKINGLSLRVI